MDIRDGGLGFPRLGTITAASSLKSGLRFLNSPDLAIRTFASYNGPETRLRKLARSIRLECPLPDTKTIDRWKQKRKQPELSNWGASRTQGKALRSLADDPIGNGWLYDPTLLKPCRFLAVLKMRTDICPTKVAMNRAVPRQDLLCRKCKLLPEMLAHVIGQCSYTKAERIKRQLVMDKVSQCAVLVKEPSLIVLVVDVKVRHEDGNYLKNGRQDKVNK